MAGEADAVHVGRKVLITSAYPDPEPITSFLRLVEQDRYGVHTVTEDPDEADLIMFVENSHYKGDPFFRVLRSHPWVTAYREKCFMYNEHDRPWCVLPGLYFSMPKNQIDWTRQRPCGFVRELNPHVAFSPPDDSQADILFSFEGRRYPGLRSRLLEIDHPRALIRDTSTFSVYAKRDLDASQRIHLQTYADGLARSKFVLCPRGVATSSLRPFEVMKAGRVPVIIADQYAFPVGPEWSSFAVMVAESDTASIPQILEAKEPEWREMANRARTEWEAWFAPEVLFQRMIEDCVAILDSRRMPESLAQRIPQRAYLNWRGRALVRPVRDRLRSRSKGLIP